MYFFYPDEHEIRIQEEESIRSQMKIRAESQ